MSTARLAARCSPADQEHVSVCEILDRVLTKGVVVVGEVVISVADIDLIYLGLQLVLSSVETRKQERGPAGKTPRQEKSHACG
jgi:hypothetical protein